MYKSESIHSEAENLLQHINDDNPHIPIFAEMAREREYSAPNPIDKQYEFLEKPAMVNDDKPVRNVLEMNKR